MPKPNRLPPARRDPRPQAPDIVTARAHRGRFPARGHAEQQPQWQVSRRNETAAPHPHYYRSTDTTSFKRRASTRHDPPTTLV